MKKSVCSFLIGGIVWVFCLRTRGLLACNSRTARMDKLQRSGVQLSERRASLGIMRAQLRARLKSLEHHNAVASWGSGEINHYADRRMMIYHHLETSWTGDVFFCGEGGLKERVKAGKSKRVSRAKSCHLR